MIPITRKELYLNKIVGNNDYETPEKPITEEEFFFAEILGEAVQAPEPLTRYQIYLAKIAGKDVEIPYPETRLEYFLARAAGMDVETPVPITREEIYWSNYTAIVEFEVEGVPPLVYKAIEGTLENYRIYGNTVNGENVGDLITEGEHAGEYSVPVTVTNGADTQTTNLYLPEPLKMVGDEAEYIDYAEQKQHRVRANYLQSSDFEAGAIYTGPNYINRSYKNSKTSPGEFNFDSTRKRSTKLITISGTYTISIADGWEFGIVMFPNDKNSGELFIYNTEPVTISNCTFAVQLRKVDLSDISSADISDYKIMLNKGSTALPYEPYIENTEVDVALPEIAVTAGTNTLSVGTTVQPSKVYIKGEKRRD